MHFNQIMNLFSSLRNTFYVLCGVHTIRLDDERSNLFALILIRRCKCRKMKSNINGNLQFTRGNMKYLIDYINFDEPLSKARNI